MKEFIEKLISRLEEFRNDKYMNGVDRFTTREKRVFDIAEEIINQLAEEYINCSTDTSTNTSSGWIPTSERLPEKNAIVLTCDKDGWISVKVNMPYAGVKNDFECGYYTAWMPLPEPFTPKEGRE